jgi:DNA-binding transcriptional MocR family regulator
MYARLAEAITDCGSYGVLGAARLPAERDLAEHLGVSRGTVVAAYDALRAHGIARSVRGSGTFVSPPRTGAAGLPATHESPTFSKLMDPEQVPIDMSMAALQTPEILADSRVSLADALPLFPRHGYTPLGAPALRAAIATHLTAAGRSGPTEPRQVLVTAGGQGALSLIAAGLIRPGDRVLVEAPTYPGAIEIFSRAGARIEAIERDHAGVMRERLEHALSTGPARLLYLVPSCHNPTGTHMSEHRRREVLRLAADWRLLTVEDTAMADLAAGPVPPDLSALASEGVISVGSLSKCYWAGLRIGWIRAAPEMVQRLGRLRAAVDLGGPVLEQAAAIPMFEDFERTTGPVRAAARERLAVLVAELRRRLPELEFDEPVGGWSVWAALPWGSAERFAQFALRHGVAVATGGPMAPDDRFSAYLRISAGAAPAEIVRGVELLARAWEQMAAQPDPGAEAIALPV